MALPTSGPLSLNQIHIEAGGTSGTTASINDADIRALIGKASETTMSFSEWYGASGSVTINLTIAADTLNYNIASERGGTYVAGATTVNLTINSGVTVGSTSTFTPALNTGSTWTAGDTINIINNGTIKGLGGTGGAGGNIVYNTSVGDGSTGTVGGRAFRAQFACTFTNNGSVYGGGGGGGGGGSIEGLETKTIQSYAYGGGGGGGGAGVNSGTGGAGGTASGATLLDNGDAGSSGTATAGGSGGVGGWNNSASTSSAGAGGAGGGLGSSGGTGVTPTGGFTMGAGGAGGLAGHYQFGASFINGGAGIGGTVGGRSTG